MNAYILAGGKGERVNACKAFLKLKGKYLIDIVLEKLTFLFSDIYIVIKPEQEERFKAYKNLVIEEEKGFSSLLGIHSALSHSTKKWNFIIGTDMPGAEPKLIEGMKRYIEGYEIIVPMVRGYPEPLFAFYHKDILPLIREQIAIGEMKIQKLYQKAKVHYLKEEIIKRYDPFLTSFININTWEDYRKASELLE